METLRTHYFQKSIVFSSTKSVTFYYTALRSTLAGKVVTAFSQVKMRNSATDLMFRV